MPFNFFFENITDKIITSSKIIHKLYLLLFRFSASVIPAGDGVFRTVLRGPPGHFQKENTYINYIDETNEYFFDANSSNISDPIDEVTYAHPAELVSDS